MAKKLYMGNEAFAHAALAAGVRVVAGYPGTPSSELIETVAKEHAARRAEGVHVEWSTNEKAALELLAGASYAGARTLFTCKMVGLNVASDALMSLNYVGVKGGTVLFVADDPGPISSQTEQDTRRFASFAKLPVLDPTTPEEGCEMMAAAFELSEAYRTPVIVRPTTRINHASTFMEFPEVTHAKPVPAEGFERDPKWVIFPRRAFQAHGEINERLRSIAQDFARGPLARFNPIVEVPAGGAFDEAPVYEGASFADELDRRGVARVTAGDGQLAAAPADAEGAVSDIMPAAVPAAPDAVPAAAPGAAPDAAREVDASVPRIGIAAGGVSAAYVREALGMLEELARAAGTELPAYRFIQVGTPYPFPEDAARAFLDGLDTVVVFEELDHVIEDELLMLSGRAHLACQVHGRRDGVTRDRGENTVDDTLRRLASAFATFAGMPQNVAAALPDPAAFDGALPTRPPVLCAGCPHRGSFSAVKRALGGRPAVLCGDIGCYTLGNAQPLDAVDTCLCMGAGITMAQGFAVAEPSKKCVAFVGDSTFFASGMTGVANAVYNQHDVTIVVLDNATTAMTGGQPHPGTGITLMGPQSQPIDIEETLRALGVTCVVRANPFDLDEATAAAREAIDFEGPSALIYVGPCIQLSKPGKPVRINSGTCTGCKKCITSIGCPAIGFDVDARGPKAKRGQAVVDTSLCTGCGLCTFTCPFGAIEKEARDD